MTIKKKFQKIFSQIRKSINNENNYFLMKMKPINEFICRKKY